MRIFDSLDDILRESTGIVPQRKIEDCTNYLDRLSIDGISEDELAQYYRDYYIIRLVGGFGNYFSKIAESKVVSNATESLDPYKVASDLKVTYGLADWELNVVVAENDVPILLLIADINKNCEIIETEMDKAGYFLGFSANVSSPVGNWKKNAV